jgi:hypothetical protein
MSDVNRTQAIWVFAVTAFVVALLLAFEVSGI